MARKKKPEEHENHERWLVSYADFITLLFAFFVVMYSMSSVNEGKYRALSDSMTAAFNPTAPKSLRPIQIGSVSKSPRPVFPIILEIPKAINIVPVALSRAISERDKEGSGGGQGARGSIDTDTVGETVGVAVRVVDGIESDGDGAGDGGAAVGGVGGAEGDLALMQATQQIEFIASDVTAIFENLIDDQQISLTETPLWLEIEIKSNILFNSGSAILATEAEEILSGLGSLFSTYPNQITVEGFTDNMPIQSPIFPSNWELSSARAAAVVRLFEAYGVEPIRMSSVGYGEFRPSSDNATEEGRASNRKVVVVVMANIESQSQSEDIEIPFNDLELFRQRSSSSGGF